MSEENLNIIISNLKDELKGIYPDFKGIYLFGSRNRGDYRNDSDFDIALIFDCKIDTRLKKEISSIIYQYELSYDILIDDIFSIHPIF